MIRARPLVAVFFAAALCVYARAAPARPQIPSSGNVVVVGDSLTAPGYYPDAIYESTGGTYTLIGSQSTPDGHGCEGYSGWAFADFATETSSPFVVSGVINWAPWVGSYGTPAIAIFSLGINDLFPQPLGSALNAQIVIELGHADDLITGLRAVAPNVIVIVTTPPPGNEYQAAWDDDYSPPLNDRELWRQKLAVIRAAFAAHFVGRTNEGIWYLQLHADPASEYDALNALHPSVYGYHRLGRQVAKLLESD